VQVSPSAPDLISLYWTVSGPVEIGTGREWSLFDVADRAAEAAKVGFSGIGIWHADLEHILTTRSLTELKRILDDNGLHQLELEFLYDWFLDDGDERKKASDATRTMVFEAAGVLEPHHIKVGNIRRRPISVARITESFGELCADAARHTAAKVAYELLPFDTKESSLRTVLGIVEGAGPNGGIAIDTWHMGKLRIAPDDLRQIPLERLAWIELADGKIGDVPPEALGDDANLPAMIDETINHRLLPGEGEFEVHRYVEVCRDMGYAEPWGIEVISEAQRNRPMEEAYRRAYATTIAQFR
jgi:sugar phosphate isomerase/epimerase